MTETTAKAVTNGAQAAAQAAPSIANKLVSTGMDTGIGFLFAAATTGFASASVRSFQRALSVWTKQG